MSGGRSRARWTSLDWAASLSISAFWHLLVLAVLTLTVHPFELPDQNRAINFQFLPPLTPPPMPTVEVQLRPPQTDRTPPPKPAPRIVVRPGAQALSRSPEVRPQQTPPPRQLLDQARPQQSDLDKPVEIERRSVQSPRLQTQQATPQIPEAPPEPVQVTRQAPAARPQVEVPRTEAQGRPRPLDTSRAPPALPQAAAPEASQSAVPEAAAAQSQVQVLTNENVIQAPVEIRPRERAPASSRLTTQPGAVDIPAPAPGGPPPGGGPAGGQAAGPAGGAGGQGGVGRPSVEDFNGVNGINGGFGAKGGLRTTLGCENPDTYKLTPEERAACLQRFGERAKAAPDLGLPIPARKQAEYDRFKACQNAYTLNKGAVPNAYDKVPGALLNGLSPGPSLKECPPSTR